MFKSISLHNQTYTPALFLAPMAGITNSAFRRLIADFGGYGASFTEMLSGKALVHENFEMSPYTKRREHEGAVIYQLQLNGEEDIKRIIHKISENGCAGIDLNLGCPAPSIRKRSAGAALFDDSNRVGVILETIRETWDGHLSIKCRLGSNPDNWKQKFVEKCEIFDKFNIDAITVHPRFSGDKLRKLAKWEVFNWIGSQTSIPIIANGDIVSPDQILNNREIFSSVSGIMLGRIAVAKPWVFNEFYNHLCLDKLTDYSIEIDYAEVWDQLYRYTLEDFPAEKAIGRIKEFSAYYAKNFFYGHTFFSIVQGAVTLEQLHRGAMQFLGQMPKICNTVSVGGI